MKMNPKTTLFEVLDRIAKATDPIPPIHALGIGSDLDILMIPRDKAKSKQAQEGRRNLEFSSNRFGTKLESQD